MKTSRFFSPAVAVPSLAAMLALITWLNVASLGAVKAAAPGATVPDMQFHYQPQDLAPMFAALGEKGREAYLAMDNWDMVFPGLAALAYFSGIGLLLRRLFPDRPRLWALGFVTLLGPLFDYSENCIFRAIVQNPMADWGILPSLASGFSTAKFLFTVVAILAYLGLASALAAKALKNRHRG